MNGSVSPTSSRASTPSSLDNSSRNTSRRTSSTTSINDLSQFLNRHTITSRRPSMSLDARIHDPLPNLPGTHHARHSSSRRQSRMRRRCSAASLSRVDGLVEDLITSGSTYDSSPSSTLSESTTSPSFSPDEAPLTANSYFNLAHQPPMSTIPDTEDMASRHHHHLSPEEYKSSQGPMQAPSNDAVMGGKPERVMKPITMRRRREKVKGTGNKRLSD